MITIDFDILMGPSIGLYNDFVTTSDSYEDYRKRFPFIGETPPIDLYKYEYLTGVIAQAVKNENNIAFIDSHEEIVKLITQWRYTEKNQLKHLINIDHHHDTGYDSDLKVILEPDVGNWARYLKDKKILQKYTWIKNENSDVGENVEKYTDEIKNFEDFTKQYPDYKVNDTIVVCGSPQWIPAAYQPLFLSWKTMCDIIK